MRVPMPMPKSVCEAAIVIESEQQLTCSAGNYSFTTINPNVGVAHCPVR